MIRLGVDPGSEIINQFGWGKLVRILFLGLCQFVLIKEVSIDLNRTARRSRSGVHKTGVERREAKTQDVRVLHLPCRINQLLLRVWFTLGISPVPLIQRPIHQLF